MPGGRRPGTWKCRCGGWNTPEDHPCRHCGAERGSKPPSLAKRAKPRKRREKARERPVAPVPTDPKRPRNRQSFANKPFALDIERNVQRRLDERRRAEEAANDDV